MYVRHEDPSQSPRDPDNTNQPESELDDWNDTPRGAGWRPNRVAVVIGVIAVLFVATVIAGLANRGGDDDDTTGPDPKAPTSGKTLPRGNVVAGAGGSADLFGTPIKYPHTQTGGESAGINEAVATNGPLVLSEATRDAVNRYMFTAAAASRGLPVDATSAENERQKAGLDENGQVVNDDGTVDPEADYLGGIFIPEYGAYRVLPGATADRVTVEMWGPLLSGTVRSTGNDDADATWSMFDVTVVWDRGDWRIDAITSPSGEPPAPANPSVLNVSFAERAALLSEADGWKLVKNATESTAEYPDGVAKP